MAGNFDVRLRVFTSTSNTFQALSGYDYAFNNPDRNRSTVSSSPSFLVGVFKQAITRAHTTIAFHEETRRARRVSSRETIFARVRVIACSTIPERNCGSCNFSFLKNPLVQINHKLNSKPYDYHY